tara:strand:+ start:224 stop:898 length:675 start_codon:yes stop_codon:yes gene_type:complete
MEELNRIFKQLDSNQIKISVKKVSLTKSSLINLESFTLYKFNDNYDYKHNIWFILYYFKNQIDDKTYIEQNSIFKDSMMKLLETFEKEKKSKIYDKKEVSKSIQQILNTGLSTKLYLSNLYNINIYLLYVKLDICIKFGNNEDSYLLLYDNDKMNLYYNSEDSTCEIDDSIIVKYDDLKNYKKLKIAELRALCEKLKIELTHNEKKKTKAVLNNNIEEFLDNML